MRMFPPESAVVGEIVGFGRQHADGTFAVPHDRATEMELVHGWRRVGDKRPLTREAFDEQEERHKAEMAEKDREIAQLRGENSAMLAANGGLNQQIRELISRNRNAPAPAAQPPKPAAAGRPPNVAANRSEGLSQT